jgi:hypothetical protein
MKTTPSTPFSTQDDWFRHPFRGCVRAQLVIWCWSPAKPRRKAQGAASDVYLQFLMLKENENDPVSDRTGSVPNFEAGSAQATAGAGSTDGQAHEA